MQASLVKDCILHFGGFLCLVINMHHKHQGSKNGAQGTLYANSRGPNYLRLILFDIDFYIILETTC